MKTHCLFEQSGTFKNEFKKLGIESYDYDILNDFGETDFEIDLFEEINKAYGGKHSLFDNISNDDIIVAFFPCVRFEDQSILGLRGRKHGLANWPMTEKLEYSMRFHRELANLYDLITKLVLVCMRGGIN